MIPIRLPRWQQWVSSAGWSCLPSYGQLSAYAFPKAGTESDLRRTDNQFLSGQVLGRAELEFRT
jgi:hypothetical protein